MNQDQKTDENELKEEGKPEVLASVPRCQESDVPLFLRDGTESRECDAQDEKDKSGE